MNIKIINAGNCMMCGEPIKIVVRRGNSRTYNIFFCPKCERQIIESYEEVNVDERKTES